MKRIMFMMGLAVAASAETSMQTIRLRAVPRKHPQCLVEADRLAKAFETHTGKKVLKAAPYLTTYEACYVELRFETEAQLKIVINDEWPVYSSQKACESALEAEKKYYVATSGLSPFLSYCSEFSETMTWDGTIRRYTPTFVSLGAEKVSPATVAQKMFEGKFIGPKETTADIVSLSQKAGIPAVQAFIDTRNYESDLWIRLEAKESGAAEAMKHSYELKREIESWNVPTHEFYPPDPMVFDSSEQCLTQLEIAKDGFSPYFSGPTVWFCMWDSAQFRARLYHLRINSGGESFTKVIPGEDEEPFTNIYDSWQACQSDKPRLLAYYREKFEGAKAEALCSWPRAGKKTPVKAFLYFFQPG